MQFGFKQHDCYKPSHENNEYDTGLFENVLTSCTF